MSLLDTVSSKRCFLNYIKGITTITSIINRGKIGNLISTRNKLMQALVSLANFIKININLRKNPPRLLTKVAKGPQTSNLILN